MGVEMADNGIPQGDFEWSGDIVWDNSTIVLNMNNALAKTLIDFMLSSSQNPRLEIVYELVDNTIGGSPWQSSKLTVWTGGWGELLNKEWSVTNGDEGLIGTRITETIEFTTDQENNFYNYARWNTSIYSESDAISAMFRIQARCIKIISVKYRP